MSVRSATRGDVVAQAAEIGGPERHLGKQRVLRQGLEPARRRASGLASVKTGLHSAREEWTEAAQRGAKIAEVARLVDGLRRDDGKSCTGDRLGQRPGEGDRVGVVGLVADDRASKRGWRGHRPPSRPAPVAAMAARSLASPALSDTWKSRAARRDCRAPRAPASFAVAEASKAASASAGRLGQMSGDLGIGAHVVRRGVPEPGGSGQAPAPARDPGA